MNKFKKRVVIIENDMKFRDLLVSLVEASGNYLYINSYSECEETLSKIKNDFPDIIVLNLEFPRMKGTDAIVEIRKIFPHVEILVISDYLEDEIVFEALSAGANGYLMRSSSVYNFINHLDELAQGGSPLSPAIARKLVDSIHISRISPLTTREGEVLKLITQGNSYAGIAKALNISKETSKTHIKNIYRKLKVRSKSEVVRKAFEDRIIPHGPITRSFASISN